MDRQRIESLLRDVAERRLTPADAVERLALLPFENLGFARVDHHRAARCGFPEVIFGQGKTPGQVADIFGRLLMAGGDVLATRVSAEAAAAVLARFPQVTHHPLAAALTYRAAREAPHAGPVAVISAGTSDLPVAEEAVVSAEAMALTVRQITDVGVAGLHRLLAVIEELRAARVLIVVAGMEGALPSVVAGLVRAPVIAVPTSVGYGASFHGLAALLAMLNSCAAGVAVMNIDNGFGAAALAARILHGMPTRADAPGSAQSEARGGP